MTVLYRFQLWFFKKTLSLGTCPNSRRYNVELPYRLQEPFAHHCQKALKPLQVLFLLPFTCKNSKAITTSITPLFLSPMQSTLYLTLNMLRVNLSADSQYPSLYLNNSCYLKVLSKILMSISQKSQSVSTPLSFFSPSSRVVNYFSSRITLHSSLSFSDEDLHKHIQNLNYAFCQLQNTLHKAMVIADGNVMPDNRLGNKSDIFHHNNKNNQLKR